MPANIGHMPPKREWPLPMSITLGTYTIGALTPVTFFWCPTTPSHPDSWGLPSATPSTTIRP
eukprot:1145531-Pelagomonas_calceolata.AAC.6